MCPVTAIRARRSRSPGCKKRQDPPSRPSPGAHCARAPGPKGPGGHGPYGDRKDRQKTGRARRGPEGNGSGQRPGPVVPARKPRGAAALTHLRRIRHRSWLLSGGDWPKTTGGTIAAAATPLPANAGPASLQLPTPPPSGNKAAAARPLHSHSCWFLVSANDKGPGLASSQSE